MSNKCSKCLCECHCEVDGCPNVLMIILMMYVQNVHVVMKYGQRRDIPSNTHNIPYIPVQD